MWYQRKISIPTDWKGKKILLHFGAVDYQAEVFIDGQFIGRHIGGSSSFCMDLTRFAKAGNTHNLIVYVKDEQRSGLQTIGKHAIIFIPVLFVHPSYRYLADRMVGTVAPAGLKTAVIRPDIDQQQSS